MRMSYLGTVESERPSQPAQSHFISPAIVSTIARWERLRKDPLFVVLCVWAFLFLLAAIIFAEM